jgi:tripeptide aminopeptidase
MTAINNERLVGTFMELAAIPSPSFREEAVFHYCREALLALGYSVELVPYDRGANLHAVLAGDTPDMPPLLLSAHADTVLPCEGVHPSSPTGHPC